MNNRKGLELQQAIAGVLIVAIIAILIVSFIYVFNAMQTNFYTASSGSVSNELVTLIRTGTVLSKASLPNSICTVTSINNITTGGAVVAANYTVSSTLCTVYINETSAYNGTAANVTFTYTFS